MKYKKEKKVTKVQFSSAIKSLGFNPNELLKFINSIRTLKGENKK